MISVEKVISDLCGIYNASRFSEGVKYIPEFPSQRQDLPLRTPVVSVGADRVVVPGQSLDTSAEEESNSSRVRLKFCICVPKSLSGLACYEVFDKFLSVTQSILDTYSVIDIVTDAMKYSATINGLLLPVQMTIAIKSTNTTE